MPILIRDEHFETKVDRERQRRRHKTTSKTLTQLAEERLVEIQTGQFLPPTELPQSHESNEAAQSAA